MRDVVELEGDGSYFGEVRGESYYQDELEQIVGGRTEDGANFRCIAELVPDPANSHDPNAVRVEIAGLTVGHIPREHAPKFRAIITEQAGTNGRAQCAAKIVGGWDRDGDEGSFGVKLDLVWPLKATPRWAALPPPARVAHDPPSVTPLRLIIAIGVVAAATYALQVWTKDETPPGTPMGTVSAPPVVPSPVIEEAPPVLTPTTRPAPSQGRPAGVPLPPPRPPGL